MIRGDQYQHGAIKPDPEGKCAISWHSEYGAETSGPHHKPSVTNPDLRPKEYHRPSSPLWSPFQDHTVNPPVTVVHYRPPISQPDDPVSNTSHNPPIFSRPTQAQPRASLPAHPPLVATRPAPPQPTHATSRDPPQSTLGLIRSRAPIFSDELQFWQKIASFVFYEDNSEGLLDSLMDMGLKTTDLTVPQELIKFCSRTDVNRHHRFFATSWWTMVATVQDLVDYGLSASGPKSLELAPVGSQRDDFTFFAATAAHSKMSDSTTVFRFQQRHYNFFFGSDTNRCWFSVMWPTLRWNFPKKYPKQSLFYSNAMSQAPPVQFSAVMPRPHTVPNRKELGPHRTNRSRHALGGVISRGSASSRFTGIPRNSVRIARSASRIPPGSNSGLGATHSKVAESPNDFPQRPPAQFTELSTLPLDGGDPVGQVTVPLRQDGGARIEWVVNTVSNQGSRGEPISMAAALTTLALEASKQISEMELTEMKNQHQTALHYLKDPDMPRSVRDSAKELLIADMKRDRWAHIERVLQMGLDFASRSISLAYAKTTAAASGNTNVTLPHNTVVAPPGASVPDNRWIKNEPC